MQPHQIFIVFPDGVGIRNYLYSKVFDGVFESLVILHDFDKKTIDYLKGLKKIRHDILMPHYRESVNEKFLRELICLLRLRSNARKTKNATLLSNWNYSHKKITNLIFYRTVELAALLFKSDASILKIEAAYEKAIRKNAFYSQMKTLLSESQPAQLFCSHQRGLRMPAIFAAAKDLGIPTSTVIFSWDNLPKARLALRADKYLVWSDHMKSEMALYYPEIPQETVIATGTPQFEFYDDPAMIIEKEKFFSRYGLDPNKKIICYSGDDLTTSPDDPKYLYDIAQAITSHQHDSQWQILFRRCPVDFSGRFDSVIEQYPNLIKVAEPLWHSGSEGWQHTFAKVEDMSLLVSTAFYADVVINVGSTMAFDFAMFNKPAIFINYNQQHQNDKNWSVNKIYEFQHFRSMEDKNAVLWLNSKEMIMPTIEEALSCRENPAMEAWKSKVLGDYKNASANVSSFLETKR